MKRTIFFTALSAGILILLLACAENNRRPEITPPRAESGTGAPALLILNGASGFKAVGEEAAVSLKKLLPINRYDKTAIGWNGDLPYMTEVGNALSSKLEGATALGDLGVQTHTRRQAFDQLDPTSFSALIWLSPDPYGNGKLSGLRVYFMPTNGGSPTDLLFTCRPAAGAAPRKSATPPQPAAESRWITIEEKPTALGWESASRRLWVSGANTILVLDSNGWKKMASFHLPAPAEDRSAGPSVLREVRENSGLSSMGWFDLGRRVGRLYVNGPNGLPQPTAIIDGFPFSARESSFLKAPEDEVESAFSLTNFRDEELGLCVDIVRFRGPAGSLFAFLQQNGAIGVVEGQNLSVVNGPTTSPASAITAMGDTLIVASGTDIEGFTITADYIWQKKWSLKVEDGKVHSMCAGMVNGSRVLFAGMTRNAQEGVMILTVPESGD